MADEIGWEFPSVDNGEEKGLNDSGVETFRGDTIVSLAREICQNSLDAAIKPPDGSDPGPVDVEFSLFDMLTQDFPAIDELRDAVMRSKDYWKDFDQTVRFLDEMEQVLEAKRFQCLRISDSNTTGLTGVDDADGRRGSTWRSLVMSSGVSNKSGGITGGSFGIGKFAAFSCSQLRTVFYATKTMDGKEGWQGVSRLVTFLDDDQKMTLGNGYVGHAGLKPVMRWWSPDTSYERTKSGTDIFIPAFVGGESFLEDIVRSVLDGFLDAIWCKKLVVRIDDGSKAVRIDKAWMIDAYRRDDPLFAGVRHLYEARKEPDSKWFAKELSADGKTGRVRLSLVSGKDLDKRVAVIREPGMLIFKKDHFHSHLSFTGVLLVEGEINLVLRDFENPQHNKWEAKRKPENAKLLEEIYAFCRSRVAEMTKDDLGEELDPGLGDVLPDAGEADERRLQEKLDEKIKGDVTVLQPKPPRRKGRKVVKGGTPLEKALGSDRHETKRGPVPPKNDSGQDGRSKVVRKDLGHVAFRSICVNREKGLYRLKVVSTKEAEKGSVAVIAIAEIKQYPAPIVSARLADGTELCVDGNEISGFAFRKGEPVELNVVLDYHDYLSLEVVCYEYK